MQAYLKTDFLQRLKEQSIHLFFEPVRLNESLTSWICRNAISNYADPKEFVSPWITQHSAIHFDFDYKPRPEIHEWLFYMSPRRLKSEISILEFQRIISAFDYKRTKYSPVIIEGTKHKQSKQRPQFCSECLKSSTPYFKIDWKFNLVFGCSKCGCYLVNACPNCQSTQQLMKLKFLTDNGFMKINQCSTCHYPLSEAQIKRLTNEEIQLNNWISQILGLNSIKNQDPVRVSLLFDLCNVLCYKNQIGQFSRDFFSLSTPNNSFIFLAAHERASVLKIAKTWIESFYLITSMMNEKYSISRHHWNSFIRFPDGILNP